MIYLLLALSPLCVIVVSIMYVSAQRDVAEVEALYKRLLDVETRDAKIDAEMIVKTGKGYRPGV